MKLFRPAEATIGRELVSTWPVLLAILFMALTLDWRIAVFVPLTVVVAWLRVGTSKNT